MATSILTKSQTKTATRSYKKDWSEYRIRVELRYDDDCGNGHNSFGITADIVEKVNGRWRESMGGCCHDEIVEVFPEFADLIKWHLCSSDGPLHYIANTTYLASDKEPRLEAARSSAIWPEATLEQLQDKEVLEARLPALLEEFKSAMEQLGFTY
tara:strand:+ start:54 stop:518 length:465 start_codon:yes stop_codon:yes gene_type:complete